MGGAITAWCLAVGFFALYVYCRRRYPDYAGGRWALVLGVLMVVSAILITVSAVGGS